MAVNFYYFNYFFNMFIDADHTQDIRPTRCVSRLDPCRIIVDMYSLGGDSVVIVTDAILGDIIRVTLIHVVMMYYVLCSVLCTF